MSLPDESVELEDAILKVAEKVRQAMELRFWINLLKLIAVFVSVWTLSSLGTCSYRSFRDEGTCYVETYAGVSYVRRRSGPSQPQDVWGPKIASVQDAPEAAKIMGCQLR